SEKDMPYAGRVRQCERDFATLVMSRDLDIASRVKCGIDDGLNVGLTLDDLDQHVAGRQPELIDRIGFTFRLLIVGFFDSDAVYVQCHGNLLRKTMRHAPNFSR